MQVQRFSGIFPPIPTPFKDGLVAYDELSANVIQWCQTDISGLLVLGSNGEYVYLSEEEKRRVVETVMAAVPAEKAVLVGTGCESTAETIRLTTDCAAMGAHGALVVTPSYYGGQMTPKALEQHYRTLADASPIPILLYNVTKFTHINLAVPTVQTLAGHPNIVGIKESSGNVAQLGGYLNAVPDDFSVLVGTAGSLYSALCLGCSGGVLALANVAPEACVDLYNAVLAGEHAEARELQLRMLPVNQAITATYGVAGLKAALDMLGYFGGEPRAPLLTVTQEESASIRQILTTAGLLGS